MKSQFLTSHKDYNRYVYMYEWVKIFKRNRSKGAVVFASNKIEQRNQVLFVSFLLSWSRTNKIEGYMFEFFLEPRNKNKVSWVLFGCCSKPEKKTKEICMFVLCFGESKIQKRRRLHVLSKTRNKGALDGRNN